jgi:phosphate transport system substrate-binding protein
MVLRLYFIILCFSVTSCSEEIRTLKIKGSDTEVNLVTELAESFHKSNKTSYLSISGGGSGLGIASLLNGQADIANSSRELNVEESELFRKRGIELDTFVFAEDAIAFIVSPLLLLDSISTVDLAGILDGSTNNWKKLTGNEIKINIYGRQSNSGTYDFVKDKLNIQFSTHAKEMNGNAQIIEAIKSDPSGIGYVGAGYVMNSRNGQIQNIKVLHIRPDKSNKAYSPLDSNAVFNHEYYFRRHLFQFIRKSSASAAAPFIAFEKSPAGARIIRKSGYYPVKIF